MSDSCFVESKMNTVKSYEYGPNSSLKSGLILCLAERPAVRA